MRHFSLFLALLFSNLLWADEGVFLDGSEWVQKIQTAQVYGTAEPAEVLITGELPDSCYRIIRYRLYVDSTGDKRALHLDVFRRKGLCLDHRVSFAVRVSVGKLKTPGRYSLSVGKLKVDLLAIGNVKADYSKFPESFPLLHFPDKDSVEDMKSAPTDDFFFLPITSFSVKEASLMVTGELPNCDAIKEVIVFYSRDEEGTQVIHMFGMRTHSEDRTRAKGTIAFEREVPFPHHFDFNQDFIVEVNTGNGMLLRKRFRR